MRKILAIILFLNLCIAGEVNAAENSPAADRAYNQGVDFYNKLDYNKSADSFLQSMNTEDKQLEQWSAYNLGSAFFGQGQIAEKSDPQAANQIYQKALNFFKRAMEVDPEDKDAKYNYELTTKKIIEQQQEEKKQDKQEQKDKKDQDQKDDKKQQGQQNKQEDQDQNKQENKAEQGKDKDNSGQQPESAQRRQMTEQEAKMLLENFQQSEDKKKEMELHKAQQQPAPGVKGW